MEKNSQKQDTGYSSYSKYVLLSVVVLIVGYLIITSIFNKDKDVTPVKIKDPNEQYKDIKEPQFVKQGELEFFKKDGKKSISKIDIEIADNDSASEKGLMFRKSMDENRGMLFIFPKAEEHSFWMKNTLISLDIIFIDENKSVVNIHKNATIRSLKALPSSGPILYVVEVNAGYTDKYGIKEGDKISFKNGGFGQYLQREKNHGHFGVCLCSVELAFSFLIPYTCPIKLFRGVGQKQSSGKWLRPSQAGIREEPSSPSASRSRLKIGTSTDWESISVVLTKRPPPERRWVSLRLKVANAAEADRNASRLASCHCDSFDFFWQTGHWQFSISSASLRTDAESCPPERRGFRPGD